MSIISDTWVKFFIAAGIPNANALTYAHVFHENRIQMDMLSDLNKEYLREMGINPMGDVIAILRHAKNVHQQSARDKILNENDARIPVAAVPATIPKNSETIDKTLSALMSFLKIYEISRSNIITERSVCK